jgi:hypothetical protein
MSKELAMAERDRAGHHSEQAPAEVTPAEARQGGGPRDMVTVLTGSLVLAAVAGSALLAYFLVG